MTTRTTRRRVLALCALPLALGSCSLPANEGVTPINADGLPPEIANTTTTTTTTSTTTTVPAPTSVPPETTAPTSPPPSTAPPASTSPVDIYYADRATDGMQRLRRGLPEPLTLQSVISQLEQPPDDLPSYDVRTALEPGLIGASGLDRSVLTISLNSSVWDVMSEDQKRLAIAQIVLSFTSFSLPDQGNIGSVVMQVDGTPIGVFIPAEGTTRDPGLPVYFDDFSTMVVGTTGATTTTTAPPATTAPPTETTAPPTGPSQ
jgi:hypothetical protein